MIRKGWEEVVCLASGPSLTMDQVEQVYQSGYPTIVVNNTFMLAPWADVLYAADLAWWREYYTKAKFVMTEEDEGAEFWTLEGNRDYLKRHHPDSFHHIKEVPFQRLPGLGIDKVHHGGNSGYHTINLAYLFGASKIILAGYDHQHAGGKAHWHGDHDKDKFRINANIEHMDRWLRGFDGLAHDLDHFGVDLVNCSIETAITSCRRSTLDIEL